MEFDEERRREVVISGGGACEYCSCGTTHLREKESRMVKKMGNSRSEKDSVEGGSAKDEGMASGRENRSARGKVNSSMRLLEHKKYGIIYDEYIDPRDACFVHGKGSIGIFGLGISLAGKIEDLVCRSFSNNKLVIARIMVIK